MTQTKSWAEKLVPVAGLIVGGIAILALIFGPTTPPPVETHSIQDLSKPSLSYFQAEDALSTIRYHEKVKIVQVYRLEDGKFLCDCDSETDTNKQFKTKYDWQLPRPGEWWHLGLGYDGSVVLDNRYND